MTLLKFIHAADIHLDSPLRGLSRYESAPVEAIRNASRQAFINLVDLAIEEKVDFVLLAGDLYDGDWEDYSTGIFFSLQIGRLDRQGIPVLTVAGNHDAASRITRALQTPASMTMFKHNRSHTARLEELKVAVHGQSFKEQHVYDNLARDFPPPVKGWFNIGLLHTSLDGRKGHEPYAPCSLGDLHSKGYQYWALGHAHAYEIVSEDPYVVYPGCIQGRHVRETGPGGCVLVTVSDGAVTELNPVELDVIRWAYETVDVTGAARISDVLEKTRQKITGSVAKAGGRPLAMRIRYEGVAPVAEKLVSDPGHFNQEIKALGAQTVGDDLWIEKIEYRVSSRLDLKAQQLEDSALGRLLDDILKTPGDPAAIEGLEEIIDDLKQKLPREALSEESNLDLGDSDTLENLVEEARQMLVGRLLAEGGEK